MTPKEQIKEMCDILSKVSELYGYFKIDYYTSDITVLGISLPDGLCTTRKFNHLTSDFYYEDLEWDTFSEYTQRMILLEVADANKI